MRRPTMLTWLGLATLMATGLSGCLVTQKRYDADMASLRAEMAEHDRKCADEASAARKACDDAATAAKSRHDGELRSLTERKDAELATTRKALDECTSRGGDAAKKYAACQLERDEARQRLVRVESSIRKVKDALQAMQAAGKLQVRERRGFLVIALAGDILFDSGKAKLKDDARPVLLELAEVLKTLPDRLFQVAGHTDNAGAEDTNWGLSMERALNVVKFLIKEGGVDGKNLSAGGYAMYQPIQDNATDEGKKSNRRVEFLLMPNLSELLDVQ